MSEDNAKGIHIICKYVACFEKEFGKYIQFEVILLDIQNELPVVTFIPNCSRL